MSEESLTGKIEAILQREMKEMGKFILQKQCKNLGIEVEDIEPKDLPKLSKALAEVFQSMGGLSGAAARHDGVRRDTPAYTNGRLFGSEKTAAPEAI